jgi:hypothetical protein
MNHMPVKSNITSLTSVRRLSSLHPMQKQTSIWTRSTLSPVRLDRCDDRDEGRKEASATAFYTIVPSFEPLAQHRVVTLASHSSARLLSKLLEER